MKTAIKYPAYFLLLAFVCAFCQLSYASQYWVGTDAYNNVSTNWSDFNNWCLGGPPLATGGAVFSNDVSVQASSPYSAVGNGSGGIANYASFNNVVDLNFETSASFGHGAINSLQYTNVGFFQNTLISSNVTLIVSNGLTVGNTSIDFGAAAMTATIGGTNGTLSLPNTSQTMFVGLGSSSADASRDATLDMSGLGTFNANISHLFVGVGGTAEGISENRMDGTLYLALTNTISASLSTNGMETSDTGADTPLDVGESDSNGGSAPSGLYLGKTNGISADGIGTGRQKTTGFIIFNPNLAANGITPSAYFRGFSTNYVGNWDIGDGIANSGTTTCSGTNDFTTTSGGSDGYVNALVGTMYVGKAGNNSGGGASIGLLGFDNGVFNITTLYAGFHPYTGTTTATTKTGTGYINVGASSPPAIIGTLNVSSNLYMGNTSGGSGDNAAGTLNITNGVANIYAIVTDPFHIGTGTINMSGGTLTVTNTIGTLASPLTTLSMINAATLQLTVTNTSTNTEVSTLFSDDSGVIKISSMPTPLSYPTQYPILGYSSGGSGVTFTLGSLPGTFTGYVSNDNSATLWLVVTNGPLPPKISQWGGGVNNIWDTTTRNWTNNDIATNYSEGDLVLFSDQAQRNSVSLSVAHSPSLWTMTNNVLNYTFSGAGSVIGSAALIMNGTAQVTLADTGGDGFGGGIQINYGGTVVLDQTTSAISGGVNIASGTLQIGNNDANGALPSGGISDNGTIIFDQTVNSPVSAGIAGTGELTLNGSGGVTLSGASTYTGATLVNAGSLVLTNSGSITNTSGVTVNSATLDVSGVTGATTLNALTFSGGTLDVAVGYIETNLNIVNSLTMSGGHTTINVRSLPPIASFPTTVTLLSAAGGITGYNFVLGTIPAGYSGNISQSGNNVVLTVTGGTVGQRPEVIWSGDDVVNNNTNWSDAVNWLEPGEPTASDNVVFNEAGAIGSSALNSTGGGASQLNFANVNNIVNGNFTISTLIYTNIGGNYQNTYINNGDTLTITNQSTNTLLSIGSASADFGSSALEYVTIAGASGTLSVNNTNDTIYVGLVDSSAVGEEATLDMSGLGTFNANVSSFAVGAVNTTTFDNGGNVYLAQNNNITAVGGGNSETAQTEDLSFMVGESGKGGSATPCYLYLGQQNTINANYIGVSLAKQNGVMEFNPTWVNPTVTIRGGNGVSPVNVWSIGDALAQTGSSTSPNGTVDFTATTGGAAGSVNALVTTMYIGRAANVSGPHAATGTLNIGAGTFSAGTIYLGYLSTSVSDYGVGAINVDGPGSLQVGTLNMATTTGTAGSANTTGTLTINAGSVYAGTINGDTNATAIASSEGGQSFIYLNGGSLVISNFAGITGQPIGTFSISSGTTLGLDVNGLTGATNIVATSFSVGGPISLTIGSLSGVSPSIAYPLISYGASSDPYNNLTLSLPAGFAGSLVDNTTDQRIDLLLTTVVPTVPPHITSMGVSGKTLTITATNGVYNGNFVLLESTNLLKPVAQWTRVLTNSFNASGTLNLSTNVVTPGTPEEFYLLEEP